MTRVPSVGDMILLSQAAKINGVITTNIKSQVKQALIIMGIEKRGSGCCDCYHFLTNAGVLYVCLAVDVENFKILE